MKTLWPLRALSFNQLPFLLPVPILYFSICSGRISFETSWNAVIRCRPLVYYTAFYQSMLWQGTAKWGQSGMTCPCRAPVGPWWPLTSLRGSQNTFLYLIWGFLPKVIVKATALQFATFFFFPIFGSQSYATPSLLTPFTSPGSLRDCRQWLGDALSYYFFLLA